MPAPKPKRPEPVTLTVRIPLEDVICFHASGIAPSTFAHAVASAADRLMTDERMREALWQRHREWTAAQIAWDEERKTLAAESEETT